MPRRRERSRRSPREDFVCQRRTHSLRPDCHWDREESRERANGRRVFEKCSRDTPCDNAVRWKHCRGRGEWLPSPSFFILFFSLSLFFSRKGAGKKDKALRINGTEDFSLLEFSCAWLLRVFSRRSVFIYACKYQLAIRYFYECICTCRYVMLSWIKVILDKKRKKRKKWSSPVWQTRFSSRERISSLVYNFGITKITLN